MLSQPDGRGEKSTRKVRASQNRVLVNGKWEWSQGKYNRKYTATLWQGWKGRVRAYRSLGDKRCHCKPHLMQGKWHTSCSLCHIHRLSILVTICLDRWPSNTELGLWRTQPQIFLWFFCMLYFKKYRIVRNIK